MNRYALVEMVREDLSQKRGKSASELAKIMDWHVNKIYRLLQQFLTPNEHRLWKKFQSKSQFLVKMVRKDLSEGNARSALELADIAGCHIDTVYDLLRNFLSADEYKLWKKLKPKKCNGLGLQPEILQTIKGEISKFKADPKTKVSRQSALGKKNHCSRQNVNQILCRYIPEADRILWLKAPKNKPI